MTAERPHQTREIEARAALLLANDIVDNVAMETRKGRSLTQARDQLAGEIVGHLDQFRFGGTHAARLLGKNVGFEPTRIVEELCDDFQSRISGLVAQAIRDWVRDHKPTPPFPSAARVTLTEAAARQHQISMNSGIAMRRPDLDTSAYLHFVPDAGWGGYMSSRGRSGYLIVRWEDIATVDQNLKLKDRHTLRAEGLRRPAAHVTRLDVRPDQAGRMEIDHAPPEDRREALLGLLDACREAMTGDDAKAARNALLALEGGMAALKLLERRDGPIELIDEGRPAPRA